MFNLFSMFGPLAQACFESIRYKDTVCFSTVCGDVALSMIRKIGFGGSVHCRS